MDAATELTRMYLQRAPDTHRPQRSPTKGGAAFDPALALASKENRPNPPEQPRDIDEPESAARHQSVT
jgi:hypothetical protein